MSMFGTGCAERRGTEVDQSCSGFVLNVKDLRVSKKESTDLQGTGNVVHKFH